MQLNLMEPPHDGYYVNQQSMQGLVSHAKVKTMMYISISSHCLIFYILKLYACRGN